MRRFFRHLAAIALCLSCAPAIGAPSTLRVLGNFTGNKKWVDIERPFFTGLAKQLGVGMQVSYNPMDALNVKAADELRLLKSGAFDVASVQIGLASRDDPVLEGVDLAGVATNMKQLRKVADAYRATIDHELQTKFNAKLMTLWPFGPQILFCKKPITSLADFKGLKVRTFTTSMATLMKHLGATPITLQFSEVYLALQRGVVDCAVTGASPGNSAKWPEVTKYLLPLSVAGAMQGHFMNLDTWKKFSPAQQKVLKQSFKKMEDKMWALAGGTTQDAINCSTGKKASCKGNHLYHMTLEKVTPRELATLKTVVKKSILPQWTKTCDAVEKDCRKNWNATVGKTMGYAKE